MTSPGLQTQNNTENAKSKIPIQLVQYNLKINIKKIEEYLIPSITSPQKWKKCKILGSYIHNTGIENRKLTINTIKSTCISSPVKK